MYTLTNDAACNAFDPYCRVVANKDAVLDIEVDATVASVALQISTQSLSSMVAPSLPSDCNAQCWNDALAAGPSVVHLQGANLNQVGKTVFRVRVPSYLNVATTTWLVSLQTPSLTYSPKPIARAYFESEAITLVVVPMRINGIAPKNLPTVFQIANEVANQVPLPIANIRIGDVVDITEGNAMETNADYTAALRNFSRAVQASTGKTYWYGMFSASVRKEGSIAAMGYQPGYAAIGWDSPRQWAQAMTHEVGHNLSLAHTECGTPESVNAAYPYPGGDLFAPAPAKPRYPFDLSTATLRTDQTKDAMGYCAGRFLGLLHFQDLESRAAQCRSCATCIGIDCNGLYRHRTAAVLGHQPTCIARPLQRNGSGVRVEFWRVQRSVPSCSNNHARDRIARGAHRGSSPRCCLAQGRGLPGWAQPFFGGVDCGTGPTPSIALASKPLMLQ